MDYSTVFAISAAGMSAERARVDVAALNLANANTIHGRNGVGYQPLRAVLSSSLLAPQSGQFPDLVAESLESLAVPQVSVEPTGVEPRMVYEPSNPFANDKGFVAYAAVDTASQMVSLVSAMRSYEANVAAMNMSKTLALRALDIGASS